MKRIAIIGYRDGRYLLEQIKQRGNDIYEVICLCDNDIKYINTVFFAVPVYSINEMFGLYKRNKIESIIIAVRKGYSRYCIIEQLLNIGVNIDDIILMRPSSLTFRQPIVFDRNDIKYELQWLHMAENDKPIIHHLEAHVADGCNLNCKGCLHFSNLYRKDEFPDLDSLLGDIEVVSQHCEIFQFRVLGGEPLLNQNLENFLKNLRKLLPNTDIAAISNGILIPQTSKTLLKVMHENGIGFNLTLYPPTLKMKDQIYQTLERAGVPYGSHEAQTDEFQKFINLNTEIVSTEAYLNCVSRGILTLRAGRIYKCPIETYIGRYFERYGMSKNASAKGRDIRDKSLDWKKTVKMLTDEEGEFCCHCSEHPVSYTWNNSSPEKEDWLVEEADA